MKTQKELKEIYMKAICDEVWSDKHMQDYCRKKCAYVVELSDGDIIAIEKPNIEKDFCYGMGMYGTYTDEDQERAEKLADRAKTDENYFIERNLEDLNKKIDYLKNCIDHSFEWECYTYQNYSGQKENSILKTYSAVKLYYNPDHAAYKWYNLKDIKKISSEDVQRIIDGLEEVKKAFTKRLNTYLKKYGLSKLNVWTYCVD